MNLASAAILVSLVALAALAVWRVLRKGAPCECGGSCKPCRAGCCREHSEREKL